jgi:predicted DNA-binding protein
MSKEEQGVPEEKSKVLRHFDLPVETNQKLKEISKKTNKSNVLIVREAIESYSENKQHDLKVTVENTVKETLLDVMREAGLLPIGHLATPVEPSVKVRLWETMKVPCGDAMTLDEVFEALGEPVEVEIEGQLARLSTPNSWIARTDGWSMCSGDTDDLGSINHDDRIMLTPFNEYDGDIRNGMVVLTKLRYKNGAMKCTLKTYQGKTLKPKNPRFKGIDFGDENIEEAVIWAICRGVVEKVFG